MLRKLIREIVEGIVLSESATGFAADLLSKNDVDYIIQTIVNSKESLMSTIAEHLHSLKNKDPKKYTAITNGLIQIFQAGIKTRVIFNFFALFYLQTGKKFKNSVISVLKNTYNNIDNHIIEENLSDVLMTLIPVYRQVSGSNFDSFLYRSAYNAISKVVKKNTNPLSGVNDDTTGDITDFQADKEVISQNLNDKINQVHAGVKALGSVLEKLAEKKPHKWKKVLNAFEDVYIKGGSWVDLLANTSNWERYGSVGTGKRNLIQFLILPAIEKLTEAKSVTNRSSGTWNIFQLGPNGIILGIRDQKKFKELREVLPENLKKVMDFIEDDSIEIDLRKLSLDKKGVDVTLSFLRSNLTLPIKNTAKKLGINFEQTAHKNLVMKKRLSKLTK